MLALLMLLALLPTLFLIIFIYYKDSCDKEPVGLLIALFAMGVAVCIPIVQVELIIDFVITLLFANNLSVYNFFEAFLCAALVEEIGKFIVTYAATWRNHNFNYKFDGIVYAVIASLGFATIENIMYVVGEDGGLMTALLRGVLSVPSHAIDAVYMGYHYGLAKYYSSLGNDRGKKKHLILAVVIPIFLHGLYDYCLFEGTLAHVIFFVVFVIVLDVMAVIRVNRSSKRDMRIFKSNTHVFCMYCGARLYPDSLFCLSCGAPVRR